MSSKSLNQEMDSAMVEFAQAKDSLAHARVQVSEARRKETDCLNRVNTAQKKLDEFIAILKKEAPHDSDWHQAQRKGHAISN